MTGGIVRLDAHFLTRMDWMVVANPGTRGGGFFLEGGGPENNKGVEIWNSLNGQERGTQVSGMRGDLGYILFMLFPQRASGRPGSEGRSPLLCETQCPNK